jgi:hypothetical protein
MATITNPNLQEAARRATVEALAEGPDFLDQRGRIRVKRLTKYDDPQRFDQQFESVVREVETNIVNIDAKLYEGGIIRHYKNADAFLKSKTVQRRLAEARAHGYLQTGEIELAKKKSLTHTMAARLKETSLGGTSIGPADFEYGLYPDEVRTTGKYYPITDVALPSLNSPSSKNATFVDYLDAHRKSWEAATFNPIAKRIVKIVPQFVLGRGVKGATNEPKHQAAWDDFFKRNRMRSRCKQSLKELLIFGEIFWRFFDSKKGLIVRSVDPSTIWDIVTDEDDIEAVKYYHQQYTRFDLSPLPGRMPIPSTLVIRQIPADQIDHYKINSTSSEKRGRSELFPILGYLLRFKEFVNDRILLNKLRATFALDVSVEGGPAEVNAAEAQFAEPPGPAAVLVHNKAIEVEFKNASANANDAMTDADTILKVIAVGAGISENFLGVSRQQTRAGALINTEPDVKNFEDHQELIEEILVNTSDRVFSYEKLKPLTMEFTFPAIAQEDRSAKLRDIAFTEAMDYITKERAAVMAAREFQITDYNYEEEKQRIKVERGDEPVMAQGMQQMPKIASDPNAVPEPPGLGADLAPGAELDGSNPVTQLSGQMGFKADKGGRGLPNTASTLNRTAFTRGGEKAAIQNNRSSGTPLRHADADRPASRGWSETARAKSLAVRRARAEQRKREL